MVYSLAALPGRRVRQAGGAGGDCRHLAAKAAVAYALTVFLVNRRLNTLRTYSVTSGGSGKFNRNIHTNKAIPKAVMNKPGKIVYLSLIHI